MRGWAVGKVTEFLNHLLFRWLEGKSERECCPATEAIAMHCQLRPEIAGSQRRTVQPKTMPVATCGKPMGKNPREILGVGSATKIDSVEIRWPSGKVDRLTNPPLNRYVKVVEGSGLVK